jgi:hypothetical protein
MRPDAYRFIRPDWRRFARPGREDEHPFALYEGKYSPDQPRVPAGNREGGQWTNEDGGGGDGGGGNAEAEGGGGSPESATQDVRSILDLAKIIAARGYSIDYLKCLDICYPILERPKVPGSDFNENDFHKCMNACLGRKQ